ncbi:ATP synthase, partial [Paenibacillus popilliae ATCC 14706]
MNKMVTQLAAMNEKHVEPLLQFFQQSRLEELAVEELAVLENQLLAMMKQKNADIVTDIQQQLKSAA